MAWFKCRVRKYGLKCWGCGRMFAEGEACWQQGTCSCFCCVECYDSMAPIARSVSDLLPGYLPLTAAERKRITEAR